MKMHKTSSSLTSVQIDFSLLLYESFLSFAWLIWLVRRVIELYLNWNLHVVRDLHWRSHNQDLLTFLALNLADYIEQSILIKEYSLARQTVKVDLKCLCSLQVFSMLDQYLKNDSIRLALLELELASSVHRSWLLSYFTFKLLCSHVIMTLCKVGHEVACIIPI